MAKVTQSSGVKILTVRISNFRALQDIEVHLDDLTLIIGPNNAGKTSLLDGLQAAIGATRRLLGKEDIYISDHEVDVPKTREAIIDVLIRPVDDNGELTDAFPGSSFWTDLWGDGIYQRADDQADFVAIRTKLAWSSVHGDYRTSRLFLKEWLVRKDWLSAETKGVVTTTQVEPIAMHYIDAKRDLDDDLRSKGSFFRRLTDDLGLSDTDITALEKGLSDLNAQMITSSEVLTHLRETLLELNGVISSDQTSVDISPVPRRLRDLSRGIDVTLGAAKSQSFPLNRHGMGTRSFASLLVFRAFAAWRMKKALAGDDRLHAFLALEEPEAHLHPQAQRALFSQIRLIPGQRIISTHSPYFAGQANLKDMRVLSKANGRTDIFALDMSQVDADDQRKLDREVIASRGDLLFARALILFEGETEEQALPIYAQTRFGKSIHEMGFSFVGVSGGNYFPFLWLAKNFGIPWYIFSDGEPAPVTTLEQALNKAGLSKAAQCPNVTILTNSNDYEKQLIHEGYLDAVEAAVIKIDGPGGLDNYISMMHGQKLKKSGGVQATADYKSAGGRERAAVDLLRRHKTRYAAAVARQICLLADAKRRTPKCLEKLFDALKSEFQL